MEIEEILKKFRPLAPSPELKARALRSRRQRGPGPFAAAAAAAAALLLLAFVNARIEARLERLLSRPAESGRLDASGGRLAVRAWTIAPRPRGGENTLLNLRRELEERS